MKLRPEELQAKGYIQLDVMDHKDIVPFVRKYIRKRTLSSICYYSSILVSFAVLAFFCVKFHLSGSVSFHKSLSRVSIGIFISFLLIPIHELIHAAVYKLVGAEKTSFDMNLKKFYFLAIADKFVANKKEFQVIALAPFLFISITAIVIFFFSTDAWKISILSLVAIHATFCSGDFALLSYFEFHKDKTIVTYDDQENKISFFYMFSSGK